jgi:hypothetical protein
VSADDGGVAVTETTDDRGIEMSWTRRRVLLIVVVLGVLVAPVAAIGATSLWSDVPDDSIFVQDTNWMKITGVSRGCNPPQNTEYCPKEFVNREQMAAFMHRLSILQVVDAATAIDAENAKNAITADNADKVDGRDADDLMSITGANTVEAVTFDPTVVNPLLLVSLTGFEIPASGGVLTAQANVTAEPVSGPQLGLVWIEIDGDGTCTTPVGFPADTGFYLTLGTIIDTTSAMSTAEVDSGTTRIDLCTAGLDTDTTAINAHLNATWSPIASSAGVASAQPKTWQEILAPYAGALDG